MLLSMMALLHRTYTLFTSDFDQQLNVLFRAPIITLWVRVAGFFSTFEERPLDEKGTSKKGDDAGADGRRVVLRRPNRSICQPRLLAAAASCYQLSSK